MFKVRNRKAGSPHLALLLTKLLGQRRTRKGTTLTQNFVYVITITGAGRLRNKNLPHQFKKNLQMPAFSFRRCQQRPHLPQPRRIVGLELPLISWIFCANRSKRLEKQNALIYNDKGLTKSVFALHPPGNKK